MLEMNDDMAACDNCSMWVHCSCAGLDSVQDVTDIVWWCNHCQKCNADPSIQQNSYSEDNHGS